MARPAAGPPATTATAARLHPGRPARSPFRSVCAALTADQPGRGLILPALNSQPFRGLL